MWARIVEMAWSLPHEFLVGRGGGKRILREILSRYVPSALFERPKVGFGVPIDAWLRGPLRDWAETMLNPATIRAQGLIDADAVASLWQEHISGKYDRGSYLWNVLMFQAWYADQQQYRPLEGRLP